MGSVSPARRLNNTLLTLDEYLRVSIFEVEPLSRSLLVTGLTCRGIPFDSPRELCVLQEGSEMPTSITIDSADPQKLHRKNAWLGLISLTSTLSCIETSSRIRSLFVGP